MSVSHSTLRAPRRHGRDRRATRRATTARCTGALPVVRLVLAGLLLAAPAAAIDPTTAAFRKEAKSAEKTVKAEVNAEIQTVKTTLKNTLQSYQAGDTELPATMTAAVAAATSAIAAMNTAAVDQAEALSASGATMLGTFTGTVERDFLEGGDGAWDRYVERTESLLDKADGKVRKEFDKFVKGIDKQASKQGFDPDVRWRVNGHDPGALQAVEGPAVRAFTPPPPPPPGYDGFQSAVVTVESRFITVEDDFLQDIGVDFRGLDDADVSVTEDEETETLFEGLTPGTDGTAVLETPLTRTLGGPIQTRILDTTSGNTIFELLGSRPTGALVDKPVLKSFKQNLGQELKFSGQVLGNNTKFLKQGLSAAAKQHKAQQITTAAALQAGASTLATAISAAIVPDVTAGDCFWLPILVRNPVSNAGSALSAAGLGDTDVFSDLVPDGGGQYTRFLERLNRKIASHDRRRAGIVSRYVSKIGKQGTKQGESVQTTLQVRPRIGQRGIQIQVIPSMTDPLPDPTIQLGITARIDNALHVFLAGKAEQGLSNTDPVMEETNGMYVLLGSAVKDANKAFWADIPGLSDIPTVGWFFKQKDVNRERRNLIILVTPWIPVTDGET